eukprot:m.214880 g.214880  ORF g.214880 m.214880 type:complete len:201 (+) comp18626_c1_seq2:1335-1937(+)
MGEGDVDGFATPKLEIVVFVGLLGNRRRHPNMLLQLPKFTEELHVAQRRIVETLRLKGQREAPVGGTSTSDLTPVLFYFRIACMTPSELAIKKDFQFQEPVSMENEFCALGATERLIKSALAKYKTTATEDCAELEQLEDSCQKPAGSATVPGKVLAIELRQREKWTLNQTLSNVQSLRQDFLVEHGKLEERELPLVWDS